jgi:DNA-binding Xre family transcriptional regulator
MGDPKVHVKIDIMNQLMKLRNIKNIAELAKAIDVHPSNLYRINAGKVLPNYTTLARMCLVLGCQPADLLYVDYNFSD